MIGLRPCLEGNQILVPHTKLISMSLKIAGVSEKLFGQAVQKPFRNTGQAPLLIER